MQQQQPVMEEGTAYEPPSYDETFPVLPESASTVNNLHTPPTIDNRMRVGCSVVTQVTLFFLCINKSIAFIVIIIDQ